MTGPDRVDLRLPDTPGYPLARSVDLPEDHEYAPTAVLSLRLGDLTVALDGNLGEPASEPLDAGRMKIRYAMPPLVLSGRYSLDVRPERPEQLDTAGDLRPLSATAASPGRPAHIPLGDDAPDDWLDSARTQRELLVKESDNGYRLVSAFYEHNEVYNEVFQQDSMQTTWHAGGVTRQMADDTHQATSVRDRVVNSADKKYRRDDGQPDITYNGNAFVQQLAVHTTIYVIGTDDPLDPHSPLKPPYEKALCASINFGNGVKSTGNDKETTTSLTVNQVYQTVKDHPSVTLMPCSDADLAPYRDPDALLSRMAGQGGAAEDDGVPGAAVTPPTGLDEEDLRLIRSVRASLLQERAAALAAKGVPLHQGWCGTRVEGAMVTVETEQTLRGRQPVVVVVDLPDLDLDFDDTAWVGEAGDIARQRIASMHFIRTLLADALTERVRAAVLAGSPGLAHPALTAEEP